MTDPARFAHECVVIAIPVFNEARFIGRAIQSLKQQEWSDFLVLVSDNASTDGTERVCKEAIGGDPRFHYVRHEKNQGALFNFNFVLDCTDSKYFMWLSAHDFVTSDFLSTHLQALEVRLPLQPVLFADAVDRPRRPAATRNQCQQSRRFRGRTDGPLPGVRSAPG